MEECYTCREAGGASAKAEFLAKDIKTLTLYALCRTHYAIWAASPDCSRLEFSMLGHQLLSELPPVTPQQAADFVPDHARCYEVVRNLLVSYRAAMSALGQKTNTELTKEAEMLLGVSR